MGYILTMSFMLLLIIAVIIAGVVRGRPIKGMVATILAVMVVTTLFFSATIISARSVGIGVALGKYRDTYQSGFSMKEPWLTKEEFSTQIQYLKFNDGDDEDSEAPKPEVNFNGGGTGKAKVTITWRIDKEGARRLWENYKSFDRVRDRVIENKGGNAIRRAIGAYSAADAQDGANIAKINDAILTNVKTDVMPEGVVVTGVTYDGVDLDEKTQGSIQRVIQLKQETAAAVQDLAKANAEKAANDVRRDAGLLTEGVQRAKCLDLVANWDHNRQGDMPATWNCVPAQTGVGVVVNPGK